MNKVLCLIFCSLLFPFTLIAQPEPTATSRKIKVLLLGTFHFDNPGLDIAKYESANVLTAKRQEEIKEVITRLGNFNPDKIFVEVVPERPIQVR